MKIAILESIIMPAGHEVEFDRILVDELNNQGHEPVMLVPENFPFKIKYNAKVDYLEGGEVVTYAGSNKFQKLWLSVKRESRRRKWFNSAYKKSMTICGEIAYFLPVFVSILRPNSRILVKLIKILLPSGIRIMLNIAA